MFKYQEDDNLDYEAIERYMRMPTEEREKLLHELEAQAMERMKKKQSKSK